MCTRPSTRWSGAASPSSCCTDYDKYNPWGIVGDSQKHFDPLWGMVDPAAGTWFPGYALELAQKAEPPLLP